jgi:hypothetical protein
VEVQVLTAQSLAFQSAQRNRCQFQVVTQPEVVAVVLQLVQVVVLQQLVEVAAVVQRLALVVAVQRLAAQLAIAAQQVAWVVE